MRAYVFLLVAVLAACGDDDVGVEPVDASSGRDSGRADSGRDDEDTGSRDAGIDAGSEDDGGAVDGDVDAEPPPDDAGDSDGGSDDAGSDDGGMPTEGGAALYARYCALCHGADAEGYAADHAPAIGGSDFLEVASDAFLAAAITDGRPGTPMSAWGMAAGGPLADVDVASIVGFLRGRATEPFLDLSSVVVSGDAVRGGTLYASECATCHGASGEGDTALSLDHPNFQMTASDGFLRHTIEHGRRDTPMPGYGADISDPDLDALVAHVRTLRRSDTPPPWPVETVPSMDNLVLNPGGPAPDFELREGRYVPAILVKAALDSGRRMILLDARATSDWAMFHIAGAAPFPFYDVDMLASSLPDDGTWIIAYCACPHAASGAVVDTLRARGFENTAVLDEGIFFWRDHGYPMAVGSLE